ncbi:MAG: hypothetical protein ACP5UV_03625 [Thermoplasmata archaeon]
MGRKEEIIARILKEKDYYDAVSKNLKNDIEEIESIITNNASMLKTIKADRREIQDIISFLEEVSDARN